MSFNISLGTDDCKICNKKFFSYQNRNLISCDLCKFKFHKRSANVSSTISWFCPDCFLSIMPFSSISDDEFAEDFNALRNQTNSLANQFESFLAKLFERAIENGEIEAQDTLLLAQLFQVQFTGIRAYSYRSDDETLKTLISIMVNSFLGNVPKQNAE